MAEGAKDILRYKKICAQPEAAWQWSRIIIDMLFCTTLEVKRQLGTSLSQPKLLLLSINYSCIYFYFLWVILRIKHTMQIKSLLHVYIWASEPHRNDGKTIPCNWLKQPGITPKYKHIPFGNKCPVFQEQNTFEMLQWKKEKSDMLKEEGETCFLSWLSWIF